MPVEKGLVTLLRVHFLLSAPQSQSENSLKIV
jgi:hypothetical protein